MKKVIVTLLTVIILLVFSQCEKPHFSIEPEEVSSLYVPREKTGVTDEFQVSFKDEKMSLQCQNVPLTKMVRRIVEHYQLPVVYSGDLRGRISVNLSDQNHVEVLKTILKSNHYSLEKSENLLIIKPDREDGYITREIFLKYLHVNTLCQSLKTTYGSEIKMTPVPEYNALIVSGDAAKIIQLDDTISNLDKPNPSILLEIILLDVNKTRLEEFGLSMIDLASKKLAVKEYNPRGVLKDTITELELKGDETEGLPGSLIFKMNVRALTRVGLAKVVTHPHVVCRSGENAKVEVSLDNYIHITKQTTDSMHYYFDVQKIEAGVVLEVLPTITNSGLIHINFSARESNVATPAPNASFTIDRNTLSSSLLSRDGEVLVAGGLVQKRVFHEDHGVPFLEKIPVINLLFKRNTRQSEIREIVFYIIPKKFHHDYKPYIQSEPKK